MPRYEGERRMRVGAIHGFARMAAIMASTYKGYLGEGLGPLEAPLMSLKIPHPGKVGGYFAMTPTMPAMLAWVLGGNYKNLEGRAPYCSLDSKVSERYHPVKESTLGSRAWSCGRLPRRAKQQLSIKEKNDGDECILLSCGHLLL